MDRWSRGRVTPGRGCRLLTRAGGRRRQNVAVLGAYLLAAALRDAAGDHARAFDRYENALGQLVVRCRQAAPTTMKTLIPGTRRPAWLTIQVLPAR